MNATASTPLAQALAQIEQWRRLAQDLRHIPGVGTYPTQEAYISGLTHAYDAALGLLQGIDTATAEPGAA